MSRYYIASLKHTNQNHEHIVWWQHFHCGYTPVVGEYIGSYCYGEACSLNDGRDHIAVPVEAVEELLGAEPLYADDKRFYDQRGPVVDNTRENWAALIAARLLPEGPQHEPRPKVFLGTRQSYPSPQAPQDRGAPAQPRLRERQPA